jgi:hypothetical protein
MLSTIEILADVRYFGKKKDIWQIKSGRLKTDRSFGGLASKAAKFIPVLKFKLPEALAVSA